MWSYAYVVSLVLLCYQCSRHNIFHYLLRMLVIVGGFHSLNPQLVGIVRFRLELFVAFMILLNPTSRRDASHMYLISLSPRHMCTTATQQYLLIGSWDKKPSHNNNNNNNNYYYYYLFIYLFIIIIIIIIYGSIKHSIQLP